MSPRPPEDYGPDGATIDSDPTAVAAELLHRGWARVVPSAGLAAVGSDGLAAARRVFALPARQKRRFADPQGGGHVGWRPAFRQDRPDEVWQLRGADDRPSWPDELQAELTAVQVLLERCAAATAAVLEALAPMVGVPPDEARASVSPADSVVRLLHYSPHPGGLGFAPHTDLGLATFFAGETVPGLELEDVDGAWSSAASHWVVAAGELLAVRTGGRVRAGRHRVRAAPSERWAAAVFVHPRPGYELGLDDHGLPLTAKAYFERAMSAYTGQGQQPASLAGSEAGRQRPDGR
jgi:isopenicillin N synthase-like dioxygenase